MASVLVIGYGNPLRGDDGAGWEAACMLAETDANDRVEVVACRQLTPELAEQVSGCELVVFIDASVEGPPGRIRCRRITLPGEAGGTFTHELTPGALLLWARAVYHASPEAWLISVGADSYEFGEGLSPAVARSLPSLLACVRAQIAVGDR